MGDGDLPRPGKADADSDGELAAWEPEKDDRREPGLAGGFMVLAAGVEATEVDGVIGPALFTAEVAAGMRSVCSDAEVMTEPVSEVVDDRRTMLGRGREGKEGVLE